VSQPALHAPTVRAEARPPTNTVVVVLGFAGIVVTLMQTRVRIALGSVPTRGSAPSIGVVHPPRWSFFVLLWLGVAVSAVGLYLAET
jgi:hypothetical protein